MKRPVIIAIIVAAHLVFFWLLTCVKVDTTKPPPKYVYYDVKMPKPVPKPLEPTSVADVSPAPPAVPSLNVDAALTEKADKP